MQQMELRETLEEAKDASSLDRLRADLHGQRALIEKAIAEAIDVKKDYAGAAGLVRKLQFLERLDEEIDAAYEDID
jgi:molecular chaperone HscB